MHTPTAMFGIMLVYFLLSGGSPVFGQSNADLDVLRQQIEALQDGQTEIQNKLLEINQLLQARGPRGAGRFEPTGIGIGEAPFKGNADAPVTLVEFTDYQCPFCRRYYTNVMPALLKNYINTGKLRYVLRDYPIPRLHGDAVKAAEGAHCAGDQGQYWKMHDLIFLNQRALAPDDLKAKADAIGLDPTVFADCLDSGKHARRVRRDVAAGVRAGVTGTPSFFLGLSEPDAGATITATKFIRGAQAYPVIRQAIDVLLAEAERKG